MIKHLLAWLIILLSCNALLSQAPAWQWAVEASSGNPETALDVCFDTFSSNIYAAGSFQGNLSAKYGASFTGSYGGTDGFLAKYDQLGNVIWAIKVGGNNNDVITGVATDAAGNVYVSGSFESTADFDPSAASFTLASAGNTDGFLAKYSSSGAFLWAAKFGTGGKETAAKLFADANGIYITGSYDSQPAVFYSYSSATTKTAVANNNQDNTFGAKYNSAGVVQWVFSGASDKNDDGYDVIADNSYVYFIGTYGNTLSVYDVSGSAVASLQAQQNNQSQVYIIAISQNGTFSWQNNITSNNGGRNVEAWGIAQDANNLYVTGDMSGDINFQYPSPAFTQTVSSGFDIYLTKMAKSGAFLWRASATGSGSADQLGRAVSVDNSGNVILGGCFTGNLNYSGAGGPSYTSAGAHDIFVTAYSNAGSFLWSVNAGGQMRDYVNGLALDNSGSIYLAGEEDGNMVVGTTTLSNAGAKNIFVAKLGCSTVSNNSVTASQTVCAGNAPSTLIGSTAAGANNYSWEMSANASTWTTAPGTYTSQNYSPGALSSTTYYRRNAYTPGSCSVNISSSAIVTITVNQLPSAANAGSNQTLCSANATLGALSPSTGSGQWSLISGSGNIVSAGSASSQVNNLGTGTNKFMWTVSNGSCLSSTATVTITRDIQPSANAGSSQSVCAASATLGASSPTAGTGSWSVLSGTGAIASTGSFSSSVSSLGTGTNIFLWTVTNGSCPTATSAVSLTRYALPGSNAGSSQTVCTASATLNAAIPADGSGSWVLLSGSGSIGSVTSFSSTVSSLGNGSNTFLWTVTSGPCPTATSAVNIVRQIAPAANAGNDQELCTSSATLNAATPSAGSGTWSLVSGSGAIATANSPSTSITSLGTGTNTFLWTVINGVCPTATSAVNIVRDAQPTANAGSNQTLCSTSATLSAANPTAGTVSWSLLSGSGNILSPGNYSSGITSLANGNNSFLWTVSNGSCPSATAAVNIFRDIAPTASAGSSQTLCTSTATLSAISPTPGTGTWALLSGSGSLSSPSSYSTAITSIGAGNNTFLWTVSNGSCPSATAMVTIYRDILPTANAGSNQTLCAAMSTLAAANPGVGTGSWSLLSGSGTILSASSPSSSISALGTGTNIFMWSVTNGSCPTATSAVTIIRDEMPFASAGSNQTICAASGTLGAMSPTTGTGTWSLLSGSGTISSPASYSSAVTSLGAGSNSFLWTVTNGSCPSATATVTIQRDLQPTANAGSSQTICASLATLNATTPSAGTGAWTLLSGAGNITSINNPSSTVSSLASGLNTFLWTVSNGSCPSATAAVSIKSDVQPTASAGSNQTVCASAATLNAVNPGIGTGAWSLASGSGNIVSPTSYSSAITSLGAGANVFIWTVSNGICNSATATVIVTQGSNLTAQAGSDQTICASAATLNAVGSGTWSVASGSGNISSINNANSSVSSLSPGINTFIWTIPNGGCSTTPGTVTITRDEQVTASAGGGQTVCAANTILSAMQPTLGTGAWSFLSGSGIIAAPGSFSSAVTSLSTGTNVLLWTVTNGSCPSATSAVSIIRDIQPVANAGSSQTLCSSSATLSATNPNTGNGTWSVLSGSGNIATASSFSSSVSSLGIGNNIFLWTVTNGSCPTTTAAVTIIRDEQPTASAGNSQTLCASSATLSAIQPSIGTGQWSVIAGSSGLVSNNSYSSQVNSLSNGINTFLWTVSNGSCPSATSAVSIVRDAQPVASAGSNQTLCATSATLSANAPSAGTGLWSVISGSATISSANSFSSALTGLGGGDNRLLWTVSNGSCPQATATVTITRELPLTANGGMSQTLCSSSATLTAIVPTAGTGFWSLLSGSGNILSPASYSSEVSALNTGTNTFLWTVSNSSCPSATAIVSIIRDAQPSASAGSSQTLCVSSASLSALIPNTGSGSWSVLSGSASIASATSNSTTVTSLAPGTNSFLWTVNNGSCPSATAAVTVVRELPPSANAGSNQTICATSATLSAVTPGAGTGSWSALSGGGNIGSVNSTVSQVTSLNPGNTIFLWTVSNGSCPTATSVVTITRELAPSANAGVSQTLCGTSATLSATNPSIGSGSWSVISGSGSILSSGNYSSQVTSLNTGANTFLWTVNNGSCPSATSAVSITSEVQPTANAGSSQTICSSAATLSATNPGVGIGGWTLLSGSGNILSSASYSSAVTSLNTGINTFLWTVSNGSCPSATAAVDIVRDAQPGANAGQDQTLCASTATLNATPPAIGTGIWSLLSGSAGISSAGSYSSAVTGIGTGTNILLWSVTNGSCPTATSAVTIVRDGQPTASAGSNQTICASSGFFNAAVPAYGSGFWSMMSGAGNIISSGNPMSQVTNLSLGSNSFLWTVSNGSCPTATSAVSIYVEGQPTADAGADQQVCGASTTLIAVDPGVGTGNWSLVSGAGSIAAPGSYSSAITALSTGTNTFLWTVSNGSCPSATSAVIIISDAQPTAYAGSAQTLCTTSATLSATPATVGSGTWSVISGNGNIVSANSYSSQVTSLGTGTNTFLWTVNNGSCPSATSAVSIISDAQPTANAGSDQTLCASSATLAAVAPTIGSGSWSLITGSCSISSAGSSSSAVSSIGTGINILVWQVANGSCPPATDTVLIQRDAEPSQAIAGNDQQVCGTSATVIANSPAIGTGHWQVISGGGNPASASNSNSTLNGLSEGLNQFAWIISNGSCSSSSDTIDISAYQQPNAADAGADLATCASTLALTANIPSAGTGSWSIVSGSGSIISSSSNSLSLNLPATGTTTARWSISNGVCPASSDEIMITRSGANSADAGTDQTVEQSTAQLAASLGAGTTGQWQVLQGNAAVSEVNDPNSAITHLSFGNNIFKWTVSGGACRDTSDNITVYVKPLMIPNGFSPNGDGINDLFVISSIGYFNEAKLDVYNRWGALVYSNKDYKNDWDGSSSANEKLTDDTYYYTLVIPEYKTFTGFIILKQNK